MAHSFRGVLAVLLLSVGLVALAHWGAGGVGRVTSNGGGFYVDYYIVLYHGHVACTVYGMLVYMITCNHVHAHVLLHTRTCYLACCRTGWAAAGELGGRLSSQ